MFAVICSDGAIKPEDIAGQLREEQWVPLAVLKPRADPSGTPTLLLFNSAKDAHKFSLKNFPEDWFISIVELADDDHQWIKDRGWNVEVQSYPRTRNNHAEHLLTYEVLEFKTKPDVMIRGGTLEV